MNCLKRNCCLFLSSIVLLATVPASMAEVSVSVSINTAPPALPVYEQPECPSPGYMWVPGYWSYGDDGYYWVPGLWVMAPRPGLLWTPGYWGWSDGFYVWHEGYWGRHVGFYGGVCYGYGYTGTGFYGGYWRSGVYCYNRSVTNVNVTVVHNTYTKTVVTNTTVNNVSYNGGTGGILAKPTAKQLAVSQEKHTPATDQQMQHQQTARANRELLASENHGQPSKAALAKTSSGSTAAGDAKGRNVNGHGGQRRSPNPGREPREHGRHER